MAFYRLSSSVVLELEEKELGLLLPMLPWMLSSWPTSVVVVVSWSVEQLLSQHDLDLVEAFVERPQYD